MEAVGTRKTTVISTAVLDYNICASMNFIFLSKISVPADGRVVVGNLRKLPSSTGQLKDSSIAVSIPDDMNEYEIDGCESVYTSASGVIFNNTRDSLVGDHYSSQNTIRSEYFTPPIDLLTSVCEKSLVKKVYITIINA